jgi:hypothetical protein
MLRGAPIAAWFVGGAMLAPLTVACRGEKTPPAPARATVPSAPVAPKAALPAALRPLTWSKLQDLGAIGVPAGCVVDEPVLHAPLPKGATRFVTPSGANRELWLAEDENGDGIVDRDGILNDDGQPGAPLPWQKLDAPPIIAKAGSGFGIFDVANDAGTSRRVSVTRDSGKVQSLVSGDRLDLVDAACEGTTCAVLTSLAAQSSGPGATLLIGDLTKDGPWARTDLSGDNGVAPFSIARFRDGVAEIALSGEGFVSVVRVAKSRANIERRIDAKFGAYDVAVGDDAVAVLPGASIDAPCTADGFSVELARPGGARVAIEGQVPPVNVVTRPLGDGFVVAWIAPISCRHDARQTVRAFLVGKNGVPLSSTMAVGDATGFAVGTGGNQLNLWLSRAEELVWVRATCAPKDVPVPMPSSSAR